MASTRKTQTRVLSGLAVGAIVALSAVLGGWYWTSFTFLFFPFAYKELLALMAAKSIYPSKMTVCIFSLSFYFLAVFGLARHFEVVVTTGIIFTFAWLLMRKSRASISDIGGTIMMFFYLGFLPAHFILLRRLGEEAGQPFWQQPGLGYLMLILFIVSASDVFAYFGGKAFGKNLLIPDISPKKTLEGSIAGTVSAILIGIIGCLVLHISWVHGLVLGIIIALVAQVGDLSESLIKRDAGLKDSGSVIPGHGGILDRTDSYIFSGAVGYYYILWFVLHQGLAKEILEWFHR